MSKQKNIPQDNKEGNCREWCSNCPNEAYKCKNGCKGQVKENDFNKTYNPKK